MKRLTIPLNHSLAHGHFFLSQVDRFFIGNGGYFTTKTTPMIPYYLCLLIRDPWSNKIHTYILSVCLMAGTSAQVFSINKYG